MTQIGRIRKVIATLGEASLFDISEIQSQTNIRRGSIRRILSNLTRNKEIERVERGLFRTGEEVVEEFHRKFIGTQKYRGNVRQFFAVTFESNDIDREEELLERLSDFLNERFVESAGNTGYADDIIPNPEVEFNILYPVIEVGEL